MAYCKNPWDPNCEYRINLFVNRTFGSLLQRGDPIRRRFFILVSSVKNTALNRRSNNFWTLSASPTTTLHKPKSLWKTSVNREPAEGTKHNFGSSWDPHIPIHPLSIYTIDKLSSVLSFVIDSPCTEPFRLSGRGTSVPNWKLTSLLSTQAHVNSFNEIFRFQIHFSEKRFSFFSLLEQIIGDIQRR